MKCQIHGLLENHILVGEYWRLGTDEKRVLSILMVRGGKARSFYHTVTVTEVSVATDLNHF
jgi:hypothetical protein